MFLSSKAWTMEVLAVCGRYIYFLCMDRKGMDFPMKAGYQRKALLDRILCDMCCFVLKLMTQVEIVVNL
jgi:hypothetical protein